MRCFVTFYGWDVFFNEWVGLDRICKGTLDERFLSTMVALSCFVLSTGGSLIKETWLYAGNIVVLRQTSASASDDACKEPESATHSDLLLVITNLYSISPVMTRSFPAFQKRPPKHPRFP